jgi:hypothetical protein
VTARGRKDRCANERAESRSNFAHPVKEEAVMAKFRSGGRQKAPTASAVESPVPGLVARIFCESPDPVRSRLVACLLGAVGPLAMAALAQGRFGLYLLRSSSNALVVSADEARRFTEGQVLELARYVAQACPAAFVRVAEVLQDEDPMFARSLAGGLLLLALGLYAKRRRRSGQPPSA